MLLESKYSSTFFCVTFARCIFSRSNIEKNIHEKNIQEWTSCLKTFMPSNNFFLVPSNFSWTYGAKKYMSEHVWLWQNDFAGNTQLTETILFESWLPFGSMKYNIVDISELDEAKFRTGRTPTSQKAHSRQCLHVEVMTPRRCCNHSHGRLVAKQRLTYFEH